MKRTKDYELVDAPIDGKNIMDDAVFDCLFDDMQYVLSEKTAVGFVGDYPTCVHYHGNVMCVGLCRDSNTPRLWIDTILERLTGNDNLSGKEWPICHSCEESNVLTGFTLYPDCLQIAFYFKK